MKLDRILYERVFDLSNKLVDASERDSDREFDILYRKLDQVCVGAMRSDKRHPFFLETLGDFTPGDELAIQIYESALEVAEEGGLNEYIASIKLAISYRYAELSRPERAAEAARDAKELAVALNDPELLDEIEEQLEELGDAT